MTRFLSSFVEFGSAVSEEKSKMFQPIRGQGGQLVFPIGLKNTTKQKKQSVYNITTNEPRWDGPNGIDLIKSDQLLLYLSMT